MTTYTFVIPEPIDHTGARVHHIDADTARDAMALANRTINLPARFFAWFAAGPNTYRATIGTWD